MKPTNIFSSVENYKKFNSSKGDSFYSGGKKSAKKSTGSATALGGINNPTEIGKGQYANREDKSLSLVSLLKRECDYQYDLRQREDNGEIPTKDLELHFDQSEKET
jgi:hypothetical protein